MRRIVTVFAVFTLLGLSTVPVVAASPPANDEVTGATLIPSSTVLPFSTSEDTAGATSNASDAGCGGSLDQATVWYTYTAAAGALLAIDASASSYAVGVNVFTGSPGSLNLFACGSPTVVFSLPASATYYFMFAQVDGGSTGGILTFTLETAPPPPTVHLTVSPTGSADPKAGTVTIHGTIDCGTAASLAAALPDATTPSGGHAEVDLMVSQKVGRIATIQGFGSWFADSCSSGTQWSLVVFPNSGLFKPGTVSVSASALNCDAFGQCASDTQNLVVRLTKG